MMEKHLKLRLNILPSDYNKFTNKILDKKYPILPGL